MYTGIHASLLARSHAYALSHTDTPCKLLVHVSEACVSPRGRTKYVQVPASTRGGGGDKAGRAKHACASHVRGQRTPTMRRGRRKACVSAASRLMRHILGPWDGGQMASASNANPPNLFRSTA